MILAKKNSGSVGLSVHLCVCMGAEQDVNAHEQGKHFRI